jgi:signal transduction histidine kinase
MTIGIVRPRVVSVEDLVSRTVVYGSLALLLVALDLAVLAGLTALLDDSLDQRQVVLTVLLLTLVLYGPLRQRLSRAVRRLMLGDRADPYDAVAGLASTLETADEGAGQLAAVARAVASAFGVGFVSVEVDRTGGECLVATYGDRPAETRTLPITYRDAPVGRLVLPARGIRSRLSRRDEQLLGDLVRQAATAARTSRMADELQDSRERLVVAREEERRRIRRDLHDGLGPALSGVVFRVESARLLLDRDPEAARSHLAATTDHVKEVVADVRRLVHELRPPALDDRGLVGALGQLAETLALPVEVEADDLGALPAAVEVAAYRIVAEALTNVARHAAATGCRVRLCGQGGELLVEVADDGVGIPPDVQAGVGLLSLRERAEELGGRSEVTCPPEGGTVVRAWLPTRRTQPVEEPA